MSTLKGNIVREGELARLAFERYLPYPVEAVWAAIAEPEQRAQWMGVLDIEPRAGGALQIVADGPPMPEHIRTVTGKILVWDPPHVLEHEWNQPIIESGVVRWELTPDGDGTLLKLTHGLLSLRNATGFAPGTHAYLDRLEAVLSGQPVPDWGQRFGELQPEYGWTG